MCSESGRGEGADEDCVSVARRAWDRKVGGDVEQGAAIVRREVSAERLCVGTDSRNQHLARAAALRS